MVIDHVSLQTVKFIACCYIFRQFSSKNRCGFEEKFFDTILRQLVSMKHVFHIFGDVGFNC